MPQADAEPFFAIGLWFCAISAVSMNRFEGIANDVVSRDELESFVDALLGPNEDLHEFVEPDLRLCFAWWWAFSDAWRWCL